MSLRYTLKDMKESLVGAFVTNLWFFAIYSKSAGPEVDFMVGAGISLFWFYFLYKSFKRPDGEHFFYNVFVVYAFSALLTILFGMATFEQLKANPFGNTAMIATWMALPVSLLFDKKNTSSIFSSYYVTK